MALANILPPVRSLFILGTGLLAEEFFALAETSGCSVTAFVENLQLDKIGGSLCGRPIIGIDDLPDRAACICALSTTRRREYIDQVAGRATFATLVHPTSVVLPSTTVGEGTVVSTGVLVGARTEIGRHVFLNRGVRVGHHARIGDYVTVQPGANIAGAGEIGAETYIGMGAIVIERLTIGSGVTIAAGALVKHDVPDRTLVAGAPAVIKKRNQAPR
jgi:sugar O-acyltransferase (sialic acid O-acetyltransferase NeuD family)